MNPRLFVVIVLLIALLLPVTAGAERLSKDMSELGLSADFASRGVDGGMDFDVNSMFIDYGVFISRDLEVGGFMDYTDLNGDVKFSTFAGEVKYHINQSGGDTIPFLGGLLGLTFIDIPGNDEMELSYGVLVGVKHFVSNSASINGQFRFMDSGDLSSSSLTFGLSVYFLK